MKTIDRTTLRRGSNKASLKDFIAASKNKYGNRIDFSKSEYLGCNQPITLTCIKHGDYITTPHRHLIRFGCPECAREAISNHFRKSIEGFAINDGDIGEVRTRLFMIWHGMIKRTISKRNKVKHPCYANVTVCPEWLKYSNFKEWAKSEGSGYQEGYELDKDILVKGNKVYSPDTCCFVPPRINKLLIGQRRKKRTQNLPIGVSFSRGRYIAYCSMGEKIKNLGSFDTPEEAFNVYKRAKEAYIKEIATEYFNTNKLHIRVYRALMDYNVEQSF